MKLSDAILKGMERFPLKAEGVLWDKKKGAACVMGCAYEVGYKGVAPVNSRFIEEFGIGITEANDGGLMREEIVGMLQAIGE